MHLKAILIMEIIEAENELHLHCCIIENSIAKYESMYVSVKFHTYYLSWHYFNESIT